MKKFILALTLLFYASTALAEGCPVEGRVFPMVTKDMVRNPNLRFVDQWELRELKIFLWVLMTNIEMLIEDPTERARTIEQIKRFIMKKPENAFLVEFKGYVSIISDSPYCSPTQVNFPVELFNRVADHIFVKKFKGREANG